MASRLKLSYLTACHRLTYAFVLTDLWANYPVLGWSCPAPLSWLLTLAHVPVVVAEAITPRAAIWIFWPSQYILDPLLGQGTWAHLPLAMLAYLFLFYFPELLRRLLARLGARVNEPRGNIVARILPSTLEVWDLLVARTPGFIQGALHRFAYAYLATLAIILFYDLERVVTHDYVSLTIVALLDMPLTIVGKILPFADRGFDYWFSDSFRGLESYGQRFLIHMKLGTCTYFFLFYVPNLYRWLRSWILRISRKVTGGPPEAQPPLDPASRTALSSFS